MNKNINRLKTSMFIAFLFVALIWVVKLVEVGLKTNFAHFGILPQSFEGLKGIIFSPLIHGDFGHLLSNSVPLLILGTFVFNSYPKVALRVFIMSYLIVGGLVWLTAAGYSFHIGASGVVYGLAFFLLGSGIFRKDRESIAISLVVVMLYGYLIWGVLPIQQGVSWESHLYGAIVGIIAAFHFRKVDIKKQLTMDDLEVVTDDERHFFEILDEEKKKEQHRPTIIKYDYNSRNNNDQIQP